MNRFVIFIACLVVAGCVHTEDVGPIAAAPIAAAPPAKLEPEKVWFKQGADGEEFHRTKAACMLRQAETDSRAWSWFTVFPLCMRANGWVLVPKTKV